MLLGCLSPLDLCSCTKKSSSNTENNNSTESNNSTCGCEPLMASSSRFVVAACSTAASFFCVVSSCISSIHFVCPCAGASQVLQSVQMADGEKSYAPSSSCTSLAVCTCCSFISSITSMACMLLFVGEEFCESSARVKRKN